MIELPPGQLAIDGSPLYITHDTGAFVHYLQGVAKNNSVHLICDKNTIDHCLPVIPQLKEIAYEPIVLIPGEQHKNINSCEAVWSALIRQGADRNSIVVNLGGGVVTDLGGFCAATYMRGIKFIHIPTTLLAMCDAALGGKQGVDFEDLKNYIGVFHQPTFVWINTLFLRTLSERQLRNGMAEVVKHALIGDEMLFQFLDKNTSASILDWDDVVLRAVRVKAQCVNEDVYEQGKRASLNFGHTLGHAIESCFLNTNTPLLHGECVALGMIAETWLAYLHLGLPDKDTCLRIVEMIRKWTPCDPPGEIRLSTLLPLMSKDKKQQQGHIRFSLIKDIGHPAIGQTVSPHTLHQLVRNPEIAAQLPWLKD